MEKNRNSVYSWLRTVSKRSMHWNSHLPYISFAPTILSAGTVSDSATTAGSVVSIPLESSPYNSRDGHDY